MCACMQVINFLREIEFKIKIHKPFDSFIKSHKSVLSDHVILTFLIICFYFFKLNKITIDYERE